MQYNQNGVLLGKELNVISLTIDVNRIEENRPKYDYLILHNTNNALKYLLLEHYSFSESNNKESYWSILHSLDISYYKEESQFIPSTMVNGDIKLNKVRSTIIDYHDIVFDSGILQLGLLEGGSYNETEWDDLCMNYFPAFDREKNPNAAPCDIPDSILQSDMFKNLPLFAHVDYKYISISKYLDEALMNNSLPVYEFDCSMHFNKIIPHDSVKKNWIFTELITQFEEDSSGNWIRWDYYYPRSIRDLYVLELSFNNLIVPIAFAPCSARYKECDEDNFSLSTDLYIYDAFGFIPINRKMMQYLSMHDAYYPCMPHISMLDYIMNRLYFGSIIHSRKIDNAEWLEMLKVLQ